MDNRDFLLLLLDIFTKPTFLNKDNFEKIYHNLNDKDFFNTSDIETDDHRHDKYLDSIDPDINYYCYDTCNYTINTDKINCKDELTIMNFNIRSIKRNFSNLELLLSGFNCKLHIICLTESWLGENDNILDFALDGYHPPHHQNRPNDLPGGGVITYIHKDIENHKFIKNLSFADEFNNCLGTELVLNNKSITLLNIYRSPNTMNTTFYDKFEKTVEKLKTKTCYILGDMNYNLINIDRHAHTKSYYDLLTAASFKTLITKPTRITETNTTLIDHIWTNDLRNTSVNKSHIILTDITDHLPCITVVKNPEFDLKGYKTIKKRIINDKNRSKFIKCISDRKNILRFQANNKSEPSLEAKYNNYFDEISNIYNKCFPIVTRKVHNKILSKPWLTPKLQKLIKKKNKLFSIKNKHKTDNNKKKYKQSPRPEPEVASQQPAL